MYTLSHKFLQKIYNDTIMILLGVQCKEKSVNMSYNETEWLWAGPSRILFFVSVPTVPYVGISYFSTSSWRWP